MVQATRFTPRAPQFSSNAVDGRGVVDASGLARGLSALADEMRVERDKADRIDAARRVTDFEVETAKRFDAAASSYDGSAAGFAEGRLSEFDTRSKTIIDSAPERMRETLGLDLSRRRGEEELAARRYELNQTRSFALNGANANVTGMRNVILSDPAQYEAQREKLGSLSTAIPAPLREQWTIEQEQGLAAAFGDGLLVKDPARLLKILAAGDLDARLDPGDKRRQIGAAEAEIERRRRDAEARAREANLVRGVELRFLIDDDIASVAATGQGVEIDPKEVANVLGAQDLRRWREARENARAAHGALAGIDALSNREIGAHLDRLKPAGGAPGFAQKQEIFEMTARVADAHLKARAEDPAQYFIENDREASGLYEAAQAAQAEGLAVAPALFQKYARRVEAKAASLGVRPQILPKAVAKGMVAALEEAPQGARAAAMRDLVLTVERQYGDRAGEVFAELEAEKLPAGARVLRAMTKEPARMTLIAKALDAQPDVKKNVGETAINDVEADVADALAPLFETFAAYPDGSGMEASWRDAITATAAYLIDRDNLKPGAAAKQAVALIKDDYGYVSTFRVPAAFNARVVAESAGAALDAALAGDGKNLSLSGPDGEPVMTFDSRLPKAGNQLLYAEHLGRYGRWVTAPKDTGLILVDENGNEVFDAGGRPVEKSFGELVASSKERGQFLKVQQSIDPVLIGGF